MILHKISGEFSRRFKNGAEIERVRCLSFVENVSLNLVEKKCECDLDRMAFLVLKGKI